MAPSSRKLTDLDLSPQTLILTPNSGIADAVLNEILNYHGGPSVPADNVQSLIGWFNRSLIPPPGQSLANEMQLQLLWEETIEDMDLGIDMHAPTLAPLALKGWRQLKQWRVPQKELFQVEFGQDIQFSAWCLAFEKRLAESKLCSLEQVAEKQITGGASEKLKNIFLVDFLEPPAPLWLALLESCSDHIVDLSFMSADGSAMQYEADDIEQEIESAANYVEQFLVTNPGLRVGLIATQDRSLLQGVERALWLKGIQSGGSTSLFKEGVIDAAIQLLKVNLHSVELADARAIVQSPFFADYPEDLEIRSIWERRVCSLQTRNIRRSDFFYCLRESIRFNTLRETIRKTAEELAPVEWAEVFHQQLNVLGWPGKRLLCERQMDAFAKWPELLGDLAALGQVQPKITAAQALKYLVQLSQHRTFISDMSTKVQLLDRIEAAVDFDLLWLFGCDEEHWPDSPSPQPLLPVSLQIKYNMPRCSSERELDLSKKLLESLPRRAREIVCSYSRATNNETQGLTPLLEGLPSLVSTPPPIPTPASSFEFIDCAKAPPLAPDQHRVKGGAQLMKLMASSPFDAFAHYRLKARALDQPYEGVGPAQVGQLVHNLLDRFWTEIRSRDQLSKFPPTQLNVLIRRLVDDTLRQWPDAIKTGTRQIELLSNQLEKLLHGWIPLELQRDDFRIAQVEEDLVLQIADIELRLRIDRIDQTPHGLLLIDYKSGSSGRVDDWRSAPPAEPQLPLYCLALGPEVTGIAFAKVQIGEARWVALGRKELVPRTKIEDDWDGLVQTWHNELTLLAKHFAEGDTRVRETSSGFFQDDPLKPLHRFNEFDELERCLTKK